MYFSDGYSIHSYGRMVNERARTHAFAEALRQAVTPESVVLDIGTGAGIFAFLACQFGAARVYAVEPDSAIEVGRKCAPMIPGSERIQWLQALSTELDLPEKVDIVIGDLHGMFPFYNQNIESLVDARRRHLKPGGTMIPARDILMLVPAQSAHEYESVVTPWCSNEYGLDLSAGLPYVVNQLWRAKPTPVARENFLASPRSWGVVDYRSVEKPRLDGQVSMAIERAGTLHGLYAWFDGETADGVGFSNAPDLKELVYGRAFFPLERPVEVAVGDLISVRFSAIRVGGEFIFRWNTDVSTPGGGAKARFRQSSFNARPVKPSDLRKSAADFAPRLGAQGQIDRVILEAMSSSRTLNDIADEIQRRFPERFPDHQGAYERVAKLSVKYADDAPEG